MDNYSNTRGYQFWIFFSVAFFAAVEMRDHPELVGKPVAVGGMQMISTTNYEAR
jgi:hypothetical protein